MSSFSTSKATPPEQTNVDTSSYLALWDLDGKELDDWVTSVPTIFPKGKACHSIKLAGVVGVQSASLLNESYLSLYWGYPVREKLFIILAVPDAQISRPRSCFS